MAHNFEEVLELCGAGLGVNIAGESARATYARPGIRFLPIEDAPTATTFLYLRPERRSTPVEDFARLAVELAHHVAATGCAVAGIEYRLSGQALFPVQLHDVRAAIRFLHVHAGQFGVDAGAVGIWGSSAGGPLAALAGLTGQLDRLPGEEDEGGASVQAAAESYGPAGLIDGANAAGTTLPGAEGAGTPRLG